MSSNQYKWRRGFPAKVAADAYMKEVDRLRKKHGRLPTNQEMVNASKAKRALLHSAFEWDDKKAGNAYRCAQAGSMRTAVIEIEVAESDNEPSEYRALEYVDLPDGEGNITRRWAPTVEILSDSEARRDLLARALKELRAFERRYAQFLELAEVFEALERVTEAHKD